MKTHARALLFTLGTCAALAAGTGQAAVIGQLDVLEDTANGGINPATGLAWAPGDTYRLIFITSTPRNAASTDIADYNTFVQGVADTAGLGGVNWKAVGSTATVDARDNTNTNPSVSTGVAIFNFNQQKIADNNADLWDGSLDAGIYYTELKALLGETEAIATGTDTGGTKAVANGGDELGSTPQFQIGRAGRTNGTWTQSFNANPANQYRFYAISDVLTVVPEPGSLALLGLGGLLIGARRRRG